MKRATYRDIPQLVQNRQPFTHGSCSASVGFDGDYYVTSYKTLILAVSAGGCVRFFDRGYYSQTTTRLQNIIKRAYNL